MGARVQVDVSRFTVYPMVQTATRSSVNTVAEERKVETLPELSLAALSTSCLPITHEFSPISLGNKTPFLKIVESLFPWLPLVLLANGSAPFISLQVPF